MISPTEQLVAKVTGIFKGFLHGNQMGGTETDGCGHLYGTNDTWSGCS